MIVLRALLLLLPREFRREYSAELLRTVEEHWRAAGSGLGPLDRLVFWVRQWIATVRAAVAVRSGRGSGALHTGRV